MSNFQLKLTPESWKHTRIKENEHFYPVSCECCGNRIKSECAWECYFHAEGKTMILYVCENCHDEQLKEWEINNE